MRYRVAYRTRFKGDGKEAEAPESFLDVVDGVIVNSEFVERFEPDNLHGEEVMDEDDDFLPFGTEVWEYDVAPGREQEFKDAVERSGKAVEADGVEEVEDTPAPADQ
jgi:hypothetical protein